MNELVLPTLAPGTARMGRRDASVTTGCAPIERGQLPQQSRQPVCPTDTQKRRMLEAILAVRTVMDGGAVDAVARAIVRHLHRLVPGAAVALFLGGGDESFTLAAVAGPRGEAARRRWESGPPRSGRQLLPVHFAALSDAPELAIVRLRARRKVIGAGATRDRAGLWRAVRSRHRRRVPARHVAGGRRLSVR